MHITDRHAQLKDAGVRIASILGDRPDLLRREYRRLPRTVHPLTGHCYVAVEVLYWCGARQAGYYLAEALEALVGNVTLSLVDYKSPIRLADKSGNLAVIMPVRI